MAVAVMFTDWSAVTVWVFTLNVAEFVPEGTVTEYGAVAAELLELLRFTTTPPLGATDVSHICPKDELPPVTVVGESCMSDMCANAGLTVSNTG